MTTASFPDIETGAASDVGRKRREEPNQDAILVIPSEGSRPPLFIVADGMGGHAGGALASILVIETIAEHYRQVGDYRDLTALLGDCLQRAHRALADRAAGQPEYSSMGSTAILAVLLGGQVFIANVGDSRAYLLHGREMIQLSYDHSVVADQVRAGRINSLQALRSPKRNRLTQSISPKRKVINPYIAQSVFAEDDILLLCTDGLWGVVTEAILQAVALELPPQEAAEKLVALTLASGAPDNVSVMIVRKRGTQTAVPYNDDDTNPGL